MLLHHRRRWCYNCVITHQSLFLPLYVLCHSCICLYTVCLTSLLYVLQFPRTYMSVPFLGTVLTRFAINVVPASLPASGVVVQ